MRSRSILSLFLALVFGILAVLATRSWLASQIHRPAAAAAATVVVARMDLGFGSKLSAENLKVITWPTDMVPAGSFSTIQKLFAEGKDRVVLRTLATNEPVLASKISGPDGRGSLSMTIDEGMRAVAVRVNDVHGVAGFVLPGDHVDVLLTRKDGKDDGITDILLQNAKVLGVDQLADDRTEGTKVARTVTLAVTPPQAQKLTLGGSIGTLSLSLRNNGSTEIGRFRGIAIRDLGSGDVADKRPAAPAPAAPRSTVRVIRGTEPSEVTVRPDGGPGPRPVTTSRRPQAPDPLLALGN